MGEGELNLKELKMVNLETGQEIPVRPLESANCWCLPVDENTDREKLTKALEGLSISAKLNAKDFYKFSRMLDKALGLQTITKKRAQKLLMAHGYDRNGANRHIECMRRRTLSEVRNRYLK